MIRMVQRKLIIPRGDTGSFSIPLLVEIAAGDVAVFSIYDKLTHKTVFEKEIPFTGTEDALVVSFEHLDTVNLQPKKYVWDIKIYNSPVRDEDGLLINGAEINSYYAQFWLPTCEIREVAEGVPRST